MLFNIDATSRAISSELQRAAACTKRAKVCDTQKYECTHVHVWCVCLHACLHADVWRVHLHRSRALPGSMGSAAAHA